MAPSGHQDLLCVLVAKLAGRNLLAGVAAGLSFQLVLLLLLALLLVGVGDCLAAYVD